MAETIHKGWLKTREEEKFAPKTFIDNVYDSTGQQYDKVIKDHINSVAQTIKIDGIDTSVEDTFYVCDDSGNVIARIDKEGVHSIDFTISNSSVKEALAELTQSYELVSKDVEEIQESLQNLDTSDSNTFYICDGSGNIIFRVDAEGAYSTNFATKNGDLNNALSRLAILEGRLTWMDESDDSTFIIVDSSGNKAFEISSTTNGAKAYDFVLPEAITVAETEVSTLREAIAVLSDVEADLTALEGAAAKNSDLEELEGTVSGLTSTVSGLTQTLTALDDVLDWDADDNFTIVDNSGNKIATFDASGATSINFIIGTTGWNKKYDNLVDVIEALIDLEDEYTSTIGNATTSGTILYRLAQLESWKSTASSQITQLQAADTALSGRIDVLEQFKNDIDKTYATDEDVNALAGRVSELEAEDILINADIDNLQAKDGSLQTQITTLGDEVNKIQDVIDVTVGDTALTVVDQNNFKIMEVDNTGVASIDFIVSPIYDASGTATERTPNSLVSTIDKLNSLDIEVGNKPTGSDIDATTVWAALVEEKTRAGGVESGLRQDVDSKVPNTRTVNNFPLSEDITITSVENATNAVNAEKATKDASGNVITSTYLTKTAAEKAYYPLASGNTLANTVSGHTTQIGNKVDKTTTVNGQPLSANVEITSVENATNATNDSSGAKIVDTYLTKNNAKSTYLSKTDAESLYTGISYVETINSHTAQIGDLNTFKDTTVPSTYVTKTTYNNYVNTTAPNTYLKINDAFTKVTADTLYAAKTIESTVSEHTQAIDALRVFKNIKIGDTTISADTGVEDTLTLVAGNGITLTPDAVNDTITINGTAQYTLPIASTSTLGGIKPVTTTANGTYKYLNSYVDTDGTLYTIFPAIVNNSTVDSTGTTIAFSISGQTFSQKVAVESGSLSVQSANQLTTARNIELSGDATGSATFDGSKDIVIPVVIVDDSHYHTSATLTLPNNFTTIVAGSDTIAPDNSADTLTFVAGDNITISGNDTANTITISSTASVEGAVDEATYAAKAGKLVDPTNKDTGITVGGTNEPVYFDNGVPTKINYQINKTVPSDAVFTDIATTLAGHYDPEADNAFTLSKDASGGSAAAWGNTSLVTGVNIQRDAKGHVTDITLDAVKMPANPTSDFTIDYVDTTDQFEGIVKPGLGDESDIYWNEGIATVKDNSHNHTIDNITGLSDKIDPISMDDTSTFKIVDNSGNILAEFNAAEGLVVPKIKVQNVAGNAEWVPAYLAADTSIELEII